MSDIIHLLPDHIANQIAAGEVIQRPSSVVKELIENSIDAGAKNITVNIKDAGRTLIQVVDDGKGMSETDARMAFERHATSKISSVDDLFSLRTMGFRGEALASIAAVAQVELRTRPKGKEIGTLISISGSETESVLADACKEGSAFSVKNLFYNVPARRKFLKSNETEFRNILTEFERVALVNTQVSFILRHNDSIIYELPTGALKQRILDVFGKGFNKKLLPLETETSIVKITGFTGTLDAVKKRGCQQYFFVNGRYMRHPYFHRAVVQAYENLIPAGEMPDYMIYFTLSPATIDVNIHPTKTEVKFENERAVFQILYSTVRESLAKSNAVPTIDFDKKALIDIPVYNPAHNETYSSVPKLDLNKNYNPFNETGNKRPSDDWKTLYDNFLNQKASLPVPEESLFAENVGKGENSCFQLKNKYIITSLKSGLVIIDRYRASMRILYEKYLERIQNKSASSQKLLFPELIELTVAEVSVLSSLTDELKYAGFELESMGGNTFSINAVPSDMEGTNVAKTLKEILSAAMDSNIKTTGKKREKLALSLAKSMAIKAGKPLSSEETELMVASLFSIENHGITPEGNNVLTVISEEELTKRI
ncbi:MAG: DNA mismatch repair endonuclease MutL [Tannerella sp.]|jgi:DNA mismatch repair protein MutL|nr:DNA mismatch repair endonuclease MutL [Tannerella sp.]